MKVFSTISILLGLFSFTQQKPSKQIKLCDNVYNVKYVKVDLCDYELLSTMASVVTVKGNKFQFGYHKDGIRNDTNFIYTKLYQRGDTVIVDTYWKYNIWPNVDREMRRYLCKNEKLALYDIGRFYKGKTMYYAKR